MPVTARISLIVAASTNDVIGRGDDLPWYLPDDLRRFKDLTTGHVVVAGRKTYLSIVKQLARPLPGRVNVVVTTQPRWYGNPGATVQCGAAVTAGVIVQHDVAAALGVARTVEEFADRDEVFVIGGAQIYTQALPSVTRIYLTRVNRQVEGDACMPVGWLTGFTLTASEPGVGLTWETYERVRGIA